MKSLSLGLPCFRGLDRGCGRMERAAVGEPMVEGGGEGNVGCRNPPGSWA